jgi:PAS domain-containing protein
MELAVDAAHSRRLPDFLERFANRAARMLNARWGGVVVFRGREADIYQAAAPFTPVAETVRITQAAQEVGRDVLIRPLGEIAVGYEEGLAQHSADTLIIIPITASDDENLGSLCLISERNTLDAAERRLLHALVSHAALSLENFRRFSQLERSKKQWVEDIDAIKDYIVVHDRSWKIVRTNKSLASHLGVPPAALVGEAMSSLRQIAETSNQLPCPFCRDTQQSREEYVVASPERIFLVSTSRTPGVSADDTRTIHVLKDMTDRREAERRYRELFDSIQEGLFFATPDGRFLDVNDAMVRMLGYDSREELLRADVGSHLYPVPAARESFLDALARRGVYAIMKKRCGARMARCCTRSKTLPRCATPPARSPRFAD